MHTDPVCGMQVDEKKAAGTASHAGTSYYFCSSGCREKFQKEPQRYAQSGARG